MFLSVIGGVVGIGALIVFSSIWRGYSLSVLWSWFMVPIFGLPALSIASAIGVALVVGFITHQPDTTKDDESFADKTVKAVVFAVLYPPLMLGIGWIVKQFMV